MAKNPFGVVGEAANSGQKKKSAKGSVGRLRAVAGVRQVRLATPKGKTAAEGRANNRAAANRRRGKA